VFAQQRGFTNALRDKAVAMGKSAQEARSDEVQREVFIDLAGQLGLDQARFRQDLESRAYLPRVQADTKEAMRVGASGTPASFVNGRFVSGARPFEAFQAEVQKELDWDRNGNRPDFPKGTNVAQLKPKKGRGPDPNKVYKLTAGGAPIEGPAGAKVTILHYLDYQ
jgi:protein-disulfide isomerase